MPKRVIEEKRAWVVSDGNGVYLLSLYGPNRHPEYVKHPEDARLYWYKGDAEEVAKTIIGKVHAVDVKITLSKE